MDFKWLFLFGGIAFLPFAGAVPNRVVPNPNGAIVFKPDVKFHYPGSKSTGITAPDLLNLRFTTPDGFEKVVRFYQKAVGESLSVEAPGSVRMQGTDRFLIDDSRDRSAQVRIFVHDARTYALTLVISRVRGEELTHIAVVFRAKGP
jgi:hypothetical protein